jgi:hypothetical protein
MEIWQAATEKHLVDSNCGSGFHLSGKLEGTFLCASTYYRLNILWSTTFRQESR